MDNILTLQQTDNKLTTTLPEGGPPPLPQVFSDVKRAYKGYRIFAGGKWTFYAASCLTLAEVADLEEWLEDETPVRKAA